MKVVNTLLALAFAALAVGCASTSTKPVVPAVQSAAPQKAGPAGAVVAQAASAPAAPKPAASATTTKVVPVDPSSLKSLQPFVKFADGTGHGYAREYQPRDKKQFVALLRSKNGLRVNCDLLVHQMMEAHPGLPFEGCEGAAAEIEHNSDFAVVACEDQMFVKDYWLARTNGSASKFDVWHRKCLAGERVLTYKGQMLASTTCGNVAVPISRTEEVVAAASASASASKSAAVADGQCPNGYKLFAHLWDLSRIRNPATRAQAEAFIAAAERRESDGATRLEAYTPDVSAFSRTMGPKLRVEEPQAHAAIDTDVRVRLLDPVSLVLLAELEPMKLVAGESEKALTLASAQHKQIVETIWTGVVSPTKSGDANNRLNRLRLFESEWTHCRMHLHGAVQSAPAL